MSERDDNPYQRWQDAKPEDVHRLIFATLEQLAMDAAPRHAAWREFERVYGEPYWAVDKIEGDPYANDDGRHKIKRCRLHIETYVSRWMKSRVLPMIVPKGADIAIQQKARKMNALIEGAFETLGVFAKDAKWCGDGAKKGIGWAYVDDDVMMHGIWEKDEETQELLEPVPEAPVVMRCDPFSIFLDDMDWEDEDGESIHWIRIQPKHQVAKRFPAFEEEIFSAAPDKFPHIARRYSSSSWRQLIPVVYSWSAKTKAGPGRRCISIEGTPLVDVEWDEEELPFAWMTRAQESDGMWGYPLMADLAPVQRQYERYHDRVDESLWLGNVLRMLIRRGAKINPHKLGVNVPAAFIECDDPTRDIVSSNAEISPQLMDFVQDTLRNMQEMGRSSAMSTMGEAPKGIRGYRALQLMEDVDMAGLTEGYRSRDAFFVRIGSLLTAAFERIPKSYKLLVTRQDSKTAEQISFRKVKLPKGSYTWAVMPTAYLPKTAEGRMDFAEWLVDQKLIPRNQLAHFAGIPEIQLLAERAMAHHDAIAMRIDKILEETQYVPPHSVLPLKELKRMAGEEHSRSEVNGVPLDDPRMEMLRQLIRDADRLLKLAASPTEPVMNDDNIEPPPPGGGTPGALQSMTPPLTGEPPPPKAA